jgi:hypothetical protein
MSRGLVIMEVGGRTISSRVGVDWRSSLPQHQHCKSINRPKLLYILSHDKITTGLSHGYVLTILVLPASKHNDRDGTVTTSVKIFKYL